MDDSPDNSQSSNLEESAYDASNASDASHAIDETEASSPAAAPGINRARLAFNVICLITIGSLIPLAWQNFVVSQSKSQLLRVESGFEIASSGGAPHVDSGKKPVPVLSEGGDIIVLNERIGVAGAPFKGLKVVVRGNAILSDLVRLDVCQVDAGGVKSDAQPKRIIGAFEYDFPTLAVDKTVDVSIRCEAQKGTFLPTNKTKDVDITVSGESGSSVAPLTIKRDCTVHYRGYNIKGWQ